MTPGDAASASNLPHSSPTPAEVLRWCAAVAPDPWFPSEHAQQTGVPRDSLDGPLWALVRAELVRVADWVRGRGQGFTLTPAGHEAIAHPKRLTPPEPPATESTASQPAADRTSAADLPTTTYDRGEAARAVFFSPRPALVAPALLAINIVWFIVGLGLARQDGIDLREYLRGESVAAVVREGAALGPRLVDGEWWRLISAAFVHIGLLHLALNMLSVAILGPVTEGLWGRWRFAVIYAMSGTGAVCAAAALGPLSVIAGASGAVWGMMLAVGAWILLYREHLPPAAVAVWVRQLVYTVALSAAVSLLPGVSLTGHLAGGAVGFIVAVLLDMLRAGRGGKRPAVGATGLALLVAATCGGFVAVMRYSEQWRALWAIQHVAPLGPEGMPQFQAIPPQFGPELVHALHTAATTALVARLPGTLHTARENAIALDHAAQVLAPLSAENGRAYLAEVRRYVEVLRPLLDAGQIPTAEQAKALVDQLQRVDEAWPAAATR